MKKFLGKEEAAAGHRAVAGKKKAHKHSGDMSRNI